MITVKKNLSITIGYISCSSGIRTIRPRQFVPKLIGPRFQLVSAPSKQFVPVIILIFFIFYGLRVTSTIGVGAIVVTVPQIPSCFWPTKSKFYALLSFIQNFQDGRESLIHICLWLVGPVGTRMNAYAVKRFVIN